MARLSETHSNYNVFPDYASGQRISDAVTDFLSFPCQDIPQNNKALILFINILGYLAKGIEDATDNNVYADIGALLDEYMLFDCSLPIVKDFFYGAENRESPDYKYRMSKFWFDILCDSLTCPAADCNEFKRFLNVPIAMILKYSHKPLNVGFYMTEDDFRRKYHELTEGRITEDTSVREFICRLKKSANQGWNSSILSIDDYLKYVDNHVFLFDVFITITLVLHIPKEN
jgi:hypothetical protein